MKKIILLGLIINSQAFAKTPKSVVLAAETLKSSSVKAVITKVSNTDGNPCMPEEDSYMVDLQVKQANFNRETMKTEYEWETVKTINVSNKGKIMEVCAE